MVDEVLDPEIRMQAIEQLRVDLAQHASAYPLATRIAKRPSKTALEAEVARRCLVLLARAGIQPKP